MISKIVKRDGTLVDFDADKLVRWAEWAAGVGVEWESIVMGAFRKCYDGCTTEELQKALILECLDRETIPHLKMAGRLYVGELYKKTFGSLKTIPTVKQLYESMVKLGHWAEMDYSDEEFEYLESIIDHDADLQTTYTQSKQIMDKYATVDQKTGRAYETPQFVYMRMAMGNMEKQPKERRMEDIAYLYRYFRDGAINPPTPAMTNLGTPKKQYASCCVSTCDDTIKSLAAQDHIAYVMTCANAGIGSHIKSRSVGDKVRGGRVVHLGKINYYKVQETLVAANKQGSRGGANTMHYTVTDPELKDLVVLANVQTVEQKRVRGIDYSAGYNEEFARRVAKNENWMLFSYGDAPELYEALYNGDQTEFLRLYKEVEADDSIPKQFVSAREYASKILSETVGTGRSYLHRTDEMNRHTPFKDTIYSSNLCFAGETRVAMGNGGFMPIEELANYSKGKEKFEVYSGRWLEDKNKWYKEKKSAIAFQSGEKEVIKVTLSDNSSFRCTPDHPLALLDGGYVEAQEALEQTLEAFEGHNTKPLKVIALEAAGEVVPVFDLTVEDNHNFYINTNYRRGLYQGVLVHNCQEIALPTKGFDSVEDLYDPEGVGEIGLCSLSAICTGRFSEEEYENVAYYAALMVDNIIDIMEYPFPRLKRTAQARRSMGIGITNLAHDMAKRNLKYSSLEGKQYIHRLAETHSYYLHKASLRLAKERGVCEWIDKTKYPDGWLPIDTANKEIDKVVNQELIHDWESLRKEIIEFGGIRNSVLEAHMPCESSSLASGTTNGLYPARRLKIVKGSDINKILFIAPDTDTVGGQYELAWDVPWKDVVDLYAIIQKFTGQAISSDFYYKYPESLGGNSKVSLKFLLEQFLYMSKMGMKTRYYYNSATSAELDMNEVVDDPDTTDCESCKM